MKKFKVAAKKEARFFTLIEAENETSALMKANEEDQVWLPESELNITDGTDLQILGNPKEV